MHGQQDIKKWTVNVSGVLVNVRCLEFRNESKTKKEEGGGFQCGLMVKNGSFNAQSMYYFV
jgi:hypothetical protein